MEMLYSAQARGFFSVEVHGGNIPSDAVPVSQDDYEKIFREQADGRIIVPGDDGKPICIDPPPPTAEQIESAAQIERNKRMSSAGVAISPLQDAVELGMASDAEAALLTEWRQYRVSLMRLPESDGWPTKVKWPVTPERF